MDEKKIVLIVLVSLAVARSEETSSIKNAKEADFSNLRFSKISPYLSPYNEHLAKTKSKRSIFLLTPLSEIQYEHGEPRDTVQKTKRCDMQLRKNRYSSTREDTTGRRRARNYETDGHAEISGKYSGNPYASMRNAKYSQENSATWAEFQKPNENKILQQALKDRLNAEDVIVNLDHRERANRCNTGKYICYCKEESCSRKSKTSSSQMLGSSRRAKVERLNRQGPAEPKNARPTLYTNILQQGLPRLYHENPNESRLLGPIKSFPIQSHEERARSIFYAPVLHEIPPRVKLPMIVDKRKAFNVRIPFASFENRPDPFIESNVQNQLGPILRQNLQGYACPIRRNRFEIPSNNWPVRPIILPLADDDADDTETENDLRSYDSIEEIGKSRNKYFPKLTTESWNDYVDTSADSIVKTNFHSGYSTDSIKKNYVTEFPNSDKTIPASYISELMNPETESNVELRDPTEKTETTERREAELFPELTATVSADHVYSTVKTEMENNPKLYSSNRIIDEDFNEGPSAFTMNPEIRYNNTRTYSETRSDLNLYYPKASKSSAGLFRTTAPVRAHHIDKSAYPETENNLDPNNLSRNVEKSQMYISGEIMRKFELEGSAEITARNQDNELFKLTTSPLADYVDRNTPSTTHDEGFVNSEECMKLFGRDVCILSAKSLRMQTAFTKQMPEYDLYEHSTVKTPEYILTTSAERRTTPNYPDIPGTINPNFISQTSAGRTGASNADVNENLALTSSSKPNINVDEVSQPELYKNRPTERTYGQDGKYGAQSSNKYELSSIVEDAYVPMKKLTEETTDETTESTRNRLLGKSKNRKVGVSLSQNYGTELEKASPTTSKKFLYSTISHESNVADETNDFVTTPNTNTNTWKNTFRQEEDTTSNCDFKIGYKLEEVTANDLMMELTTHTYPSEETTQEQSTTVQNFHDEKLDGLDKGGTEYTIESLIAITDSSTRRLPFCDNTLLLNSIKKVINDFASDAEVTKTVGLNKEILQTQGKRLLPEILEIPNLKSILLTPRIEDTIVEKVRGVLSEVTDIHREDFTKNWLHSAIETVMRNLLEDLHSSDHQQLPPMTVEEHQFNHGQWKTNLVNLSPVSHSNKPSASSENLRNTIAQSVKNLLGSPAIASQANRHIVQNMIAQSVKNSLINGEENKEIGPKMNDSIIHDALNDVFQILKVSLDTNTKKSDEGETKSVNKEGAADIIILQKESTLDETQTDYKVEENLENPIIDGVVKKFDREKDTTINNNEMRINSYQKVKALESRPNVLITESPYLSELYEEDQNTYTEVETPVLSTANESTDKMGKEIKDNEETKFDKSLGTTEAYHKIVLQYNSSVSPIITPSDLAKSEKLHKVPNTNVFSETTTISSTIAEDFHGTKENTFDSITKIEDVNAQNEEETKNEESAEHIIHKPEKEIKNNRLWHYITFHQQHTLIKDDTKISATTEQTLPDDEKSLKIYTPQETSTSENEDLYAMEGIVRDSILDGMEHKRTQYNEAISRKEPQETITSVNNVRDSIVSKKSDLLTNRSYEILDAQNNTISGMKDINVQNEEKPSTFQSSEANTQETTTKSLDCMFLEESNEILSSRSEPVSTTKLFNLDDKMTTEYDKMITEAMEQNDIVLKFPSSMDEKFNTEIAPTSASSPTLLNDNEIKINTADFHNKSFSGEHVERKEHNMADSIEEGFRKHDKMDPITVYAGNDIGEPSINYYSENNRILDYIKNHRTDSESENATVIGAAANSMQKSLDYTQLLDDVISNENIADVKNVEHEAQFALGGNTFSTIAGDTPTNTEYENRKAKITSSHPSTDGDPLRTRQRDLLAEDVIEVHEITTEMQKTYAKTVYYKARPFNPEEGSESNSPVYSPTIACESISETITTSNNKDSNRDSGSNLHDSNNLINNKIDDEGSISQLQRSQLYYISDGIKLPLEIRSLKDGTYALSISKNICEQVLKKKCPCCVPLDGHVIQSSNKENTHANDVKGDHQSIYRALTSPATRKSTSRKSEGEESREGERTNAHHARNERRKRDLIENDSATTSMPVLDFAKKYNLSLDLDEEKMLLNEIGSHDIIQNYEKSLIKSVEEFEHDQSKERNLDDNFEIKENGSANNKGDVERILFNAGEYVDNLMEAGLPKTYAETTQSKMAEESELYKLETAENIKILNKEKGGKHDETKLVKLNEGKRNEQHVDDNEQNVTEVKIFENENGRPYRYQRNVNGVPNQGVEIVKSMLYWLKGLFF